MKKLSIGSWAFTIGPYEKNPVDFDTVCAKCKELNFDAIELGGFPPHPNPNDLPEKEQRTEVVEKMKKYGLEFSGLAANLWNEKLINTDDQSKYIDEFKKNCIFCNDLKIKTIRVDTVQSPTILNEVEYNTAFKRVTETWNTCAGIANDHDLHICWEFEPGFAFNKPSQILRVLDAVNKDNFGILYDTCHGHMVAERGSRQPGEKEIFGSQVELIKKLDGRINHIHLIDSDNTCHKDSDGNDETSMHFPFGEGVKINFDEIMPELAKQKLPHDYWTMDLCFWPNAWEATANCKLFLDSLNKKYGSFS
ncbi:MAG: sugar phosphate isomerase/epimerase [Fibrobacteria bacterium]|nr:sugar phosphate isomerase/epimerase [Fibrobacteria bacterium]